MQEALRQDLVMGTLCWVSIETHLHWPPLVDAAPVAAHALIAGVAGVLLQKEWAPHEMPVWHCKQQQLMAS
jgi:hypothetical protein